MKSVQVSHQGYGLHVLWYRVVKVVLAVLVLMMPVQVSRQGYGLHVLGYGMIGLLLLIGISADDACAGCYLLCRFYWYSCAQYYSRRGGMP